MAERFPSLPRFLESAEKLSKKFLEDAYKSRDSGSCGELFNKKKKTKQTHRRKSLC
jgi:hypothetical protein